MCDKPLFVSIASLILVFTSGIAQSQSFEKTTDILLPVYDGKIEWVDLDNDLDIISNGITDGGNEMFTTVYENINGSFTIKTTALPAVRNGSAEPADYDGDGDLDLFQSPKHYYLKTQRLRLWAPPSCLNFARKKTDP
jgi:FG-GAP-like repeat